MQEVLKNGHLTETQLHVEEIKAPKQQVSEWVSEWLEKYHGFPEKSPSDFRRFSFVWQFVVTAMKKHMETMQMILIMSWKIFYVIIIF